MFKPNILSKQWKYLILFLKILYSTNRQSYDDSDVDDYYDYDDHEDFGYCYDSDDGSTIYCFF